MSWVLGNLDAVFGFIAFILLILMASYHIWREARHEMERKELYNRLMARDLPEFEAARNTHPPPTGRNFIKKSARQRKPVSNQWEPEQSMIQGQDADTN